MYDHGSCMYIHTNIVIHIHIHTSITHIKQNNAHTFIHYISVQTTNVSISHTNIYNLYKHTLNTLHKKYRPINNGII